MLLYGLSLLYGATGNLDITLVSQALSQMTGDQQLILLFGLVFILAGIAFKFGAVPFHMWIPDVYQGAPNPVTLFIASAPKIAALGLAVRIFDHEVEDDISVARGYIGMQFTPFLGIETGFAGFSDVELPRRLGEVKTAEWDLLGKVGAPLGNTGFRADLKGGLALIMSRFDSENLSSNVNWHEKSENDIRWVAGGSLAYNFTRNFGVDVSYLHIFGDPKSGAFGTPNIDMLTVCLNLQFCIV